MKYDSWKLCVIEIKMDGSFHDFLSLCDFFIHLPIQIKFKVAAEVLCEPANAE